MEELWKTLADLDEVNSKLASNKIPDDESSKDEDKEHFWQGKTRNCGQLTLACPDGFLLEQIFANSIHFITTGHQD
jgi:hypothetical protein